LLEINPGQLLSMFRQIILNILYVTARSRSGQFFSLALNFYLIDDGVS
jgi:hypothetical protein